MTFVKLFQGNEYQNISSDNNKEKKPTLTIVERCRG